MARLTSYETALGVLELDRENVLRQAEFYAAYAQMLEQADPDRTADDPWARIAHQPESWLGPATLASTYRLAAQYAALIDMQWAASLAVQAGLAYLDAGMPFGLFLLVGILDDETLLGGFSLSDLVAPFVAATASPALRDPVQQTYLLVAAASRPWLRDPLGPVLDGADQRLAAHDAQPMGPQGIPLGEYLDFANVMLYDDRLAQREGAELGDLARRLADMQRATAPALRAARRNRYLWQNGVAPVNLVDFEHVAMCGAAMRHREWFDEFRDVLTDQLGQDDPLAEVTVWVADSIDAELPSISDSVVEAMRAHRRADPPASRSADVARRDDPGGEVRPAWRLDLPDTAAPDRGEGDTGGPDGSL